MKHSVILIDPPWHFKTRSPKGAGRSARQHYDTMTLDEIKALPVADYAADDCALFMWVTWPMIFEAKAVLEAWGFTYSGLAWEWIKYNDRTGKWAIGLGYGTRKNVEPCILARRGRPKRLDNRVRDILYGPAREHSRKPDVQYDRIERLYAGPYLEMFARQRWPGWNQWGDQADMFNIKES
jgi:N6-adenosine-specific RNA methylase IME4